MDDKTRFKEESIKNKFIYTRIDDSLSGKIESLKGHRGFKNKSQTVRRLINWVFENRLEDKIEPLTEKKEDQDSIRCQLIYIRIESNLLERIDSLQENKNFQNRSQAIRKIIHCAFENGVETA